jgi:uncharacterized protein YbbC (DUF1343 family)
MRTATGLDRLVQEEFQSLLGKSVGLVCNQASVSHDFRHILDLILPLHHAGKLKLQAVFGPQHGLFGHTQDNMIEWESDDVGRSDVPIHSLYGEHREPTAEMLAGVELLVIDLQDVGARYYTFIWTMALCIKACEQLGIPVLLLDRPNPIGGLQFEGTLLDPEFSSFVGLYPLTTRHGMTISEIGNYLQATFFPKATVSNVLMTGWSRSEYFDDTDAPWAIPSPNMPIVETAVVYPGGCLLEATNMSEGRGTTRPFEIFGAPYLNGRGYSDALNALHLPGTWFRALQFEPTFNKHAKTMCEGAFLHVTDRSTFEPVLTYVAIIQEAIRQSNGAFAWNPPPYEYEAIKLPIDILDGNVWLREAMENLTSLNQIRERFEAECSQFEPERQAHILYR